MNKIAILTLGLIVLATILASQLTPTAVSQIRKAANAANGPAGPINAWNASAGDDSDVNSAAFNAAAITTSVKPWRGGTPTLVPAPIIEQDTRSKILISARYPQIASLPANESFNGEALQFVRHEIATFKNQLETPRANASDRKLTINYEPHVVDSRIVSVWFRITSDKDNDPDRFTLVLNYDLQNQIKLELKDLFKPNSAYLQTMSDYCIKALENKVSEVEIVERAAGPSDLDFGGWVITRTGIRVVFEGIELVHDAGGPQEVVIPYTKLKPFLRSNSPISHLVR